MKSIKITFVLTLFSLLFAGSAMAVHIPRLNGYIGYANSYNVYAYGATVKICTDPAGVSNCIAPTTNSQGYYQWDNWSVADTATLYFFPWVDGGPGGRTGRWGSAELYSDSEKACQTKDQFGFCRNYGSTNSYFLSPAPLKPVAVNPAPNATNVGLQQTLKWTSGSDIWRNYLTTVYDIYGSGYNAPLLLQTSNLPCNPDANGRCQWVLPIVLDPQTPYNWKIVARNSSGYTTSSIVYHFTTGY